MNPHRQKPVYNKAQQSDDLEDLQQQNSFQGQNKIFELKSTIHTLQIQKNKLALENQAVLANFENKNEQLAAQNMALKKENNRLQGFVRKLEGQNEELRKISENFRYQIESLNRKTGDFHHSMENNNLGDPSELINELLIKDKKIQQLNKKIQTLSNNQKSNMSTSSVQKAQQNADKDKYESQIRALKKAIDDLKKKQIDYKREYEGMLQSKQQIIKKMSNQNDQYSKKIIDSKDKIINELRRQHEDLQKKLEQYRAQMVSLNDKLAFNEKQLMKIRVESKKKQQSYLSAFETQKQDLTRGITQKLKRQLKDKEQKLAKNEQKNYQLENQLMIYKQQLAKQKAEVTSLTQFNNYLEISNKEYEEAKKKLQANLYEKEKQIGELRQTYFAEISELKKTIIQERSQTDQRVAVLEQEIIKKNSIVQKYEQEISGIERKQYSKQRQQEASALKQIERLTKQNQSLNKEIEILEEKYRQKSDKLMNVQKKFRKEYEERITGLQTQLLKQRSKSNELEQQRVQKRDSIKDEELKKVINISELRKIQIEEKQRQIKRLTDEKAKVERQSYRIKEELAGLERKVKDKNEDYNNLEISFDELNEKYKKGVKQLQNKIEEMQGQIMEERKRAERRKTQALESQNNLSSEVKQYKKRIKELQEQLQRNKAQDGISTDLKLQKLAHEISIVKRQKQTAIKNTQLKIQQKQDMLLDEKNKLLEYIEQLEQNNQFLNKKLAMLENKDKKSSTNIEKELREIKIQYSEALKETNLVLQKYKKLEEVHRENLSTIQSLKEEKEALNLNYLEICREKNKVFDELNSAYDQINKLNIVLMSKQEQINRSKTINCPHYDSKSKYNNQYSRISDVRPSGVGYRQGKTPPKNFDRSQNFYSNQGSRYMRYN